MGKTIGGAKILLEKMASYKCHWSSEKATPKKSEGKYEVDIMTFLANTVDALA